MVAPLRWNISDKWVLFSLIISIVSEIDIGINRGTEDSERVEFERVRNVSHSQQHSTKREIIQWIMDPMKLNSK